MRIPTTIACALMSSFLAGCGDHKELSPGDATSHLHVDVPPHGGTPVTLGDDYQIEWVRDATAGKLQAYILDGEMENFVRIAPFSFEVTVKHPNGSEMLH